MRFFVYFCRVHLESPVLQVLLDLKALRYELHVSTHSVSNYNPS